MEIHNHFPNQPLTRLIKHRFIGRDGEILEQTESVLREHGIHVCVNGMLKMDLVCLPQFLPELILGHLVTEGYLHSSGEAESITIDETGAQAEVVLKNLTPPDAMPDVTPIPWHRDWVFALADRFAAGMPVHEQTFATHSCFLARGSELLFQCEDIGRHNAVDKAVGFALINGIDLHQCLLYSSGRMPVDMAAKAVRAGIPVLVSKGSPTASAISLARQHHLTLICSARRDRMKQFSGTDAEEY